MTAPVACPEGHIFAADEPCCPNCGRPRGPDPRTERQWIDSIIDHAIDRLPAKLQPHPGHDWSYDACRFRRNSRCMYPTELDRQGSLEAGYAVWVPVDRGYCPRLRWDDQKRCPVYEPGPHTGDPNALPDATIAWNDGGQRRL